MPRVKLDYIVSFSSEDSENQANNLLANEVSKKKWLCSTGEPSCSIVLQLSHAVKIATVHIGAYHAALVEVLVGRSEKPNDQFEVLVPSSVFLSPMESRRGSAVERVRSFAGDQLARARDGRWDRVRVVCSQPYNKHCKYGLSFIHIFEPEDKAHPEPEPKLAPAQPAPAVPARMMALDNYSSDEDDFKPGELFAKHQQRVSDGPGSTSNTGAQIRQATSQALKNITDSATKLVKTPITKTVTNRPSPSNHTTDTNRQKATLMYTDDDEQPHAKIDSIVQRHKDEKEEASKKKEPPKKDKQELNNSRNFKDFLDSKDERRKDVNSSRSKDSAKDDRTNRNDRRTPAQKKAYDSNHNRDDERTPAKRKAEESTQRDRDSKKRPHSEDKQKGQELRAGPVSSTPHTLMSSVVFALSGYENPRRARLRDAAVAMGARFERDWSPRCTHLICAFPNTPKLKAVRAQGSPCVAARGEWVEHCCAARRLLPWQWFATEDKFKVTPSQDIDDDAASECDTDDEIEKVVRKQKRQRTKSPSPRPKTKDKSPKPQTSTEKSPRPHTSREISPKPSTSRESSKAHTSREISPKPSTSRESSKTHTSREISPKPSTSRERSKAHTSKGISPKPTTSRESSKTHTSRETSPKPSTSREKSPNPKNMNYSIMSSDSDVAFIKDERIQGNITIDSDSDETDKDEPTEEKVGKTNYLPDFFEGYTFVIEDGVEEAGFDKELLGRYVRAYGGVVMDPACVDSDSDVSYVLGAHPGRKLAGGLRVRADWLWRCHEEKALCDLTDYVL